MFDYNNTVNTLLQEVTRQQENLLMEQLNDLISRRLLVVVMGQPTLVRYENSDRVELRQTCQLVLKDKEYIEKLEKENTELKEKLDKITEALKDIK